MNRQKQPQTNKCHQNQPDTTRACACKRVRACHMCMRACQAHKPQTLTACEIVCVRVERAVMCGADVAETRRRASCGNGGPCVTWPAHEQTKAPTHTRGPVPHDARRRVSATSAPPIITLSTHEHTISQAVSVCGLWLGMRTHAHMTHACALSHAHARFCAWLILIPFARFCLFIFLPCMSQTHGAGST